MIKRNDLLYKPDMIRTVSGRYIDVFNPDEDAIDIMDIAHSLSQTARFGGHLPHFYSVAQHSIFCAGVGCNPKESLTLLLHDATEAYLGDMPSPIKYRLPDYKALEDNLHQVICNKFGLEYPYNESIKIIDREALELEFSNYFLSSINTFKSMTEVKNNFIKLFYEYGGIN